jgi:V/A-type H+-transporting ATPase subunit E
MPLESVLEEINKKGEEEVRKIKEETEKEVERILAEAKEDAEEILKKAREEAEKETEALRRQEISSVNLEMKRMMLSKQKEIVEHVFELLQQRVREMDNETRKKVIKALLSKNASPKMLVYSRKEDEDIVKSAIEELKLDVNYAGNVDCLGGIILEDPSGEVRINLTFDELISQIYDQKLSEVSKILFG